MVRSNLDPTLIQKIAQKKGRDDVWVRKLVSSRSINRRISPEASLVLIAEENSIGAAVYFRKLETSKQAEVRAAQLNANAKTVKPQESVKRNSTSSVSVSSSQIVKSSIESLLSDSTLKDRCLGPLTGRKNFDVAINQATLVLENRIREKAKPSQKLVGEPLVNYAFKEKLSETLLQVKGGDADDQRGCTQILRGLVPLFRNKTHHHIEDFSREDALKVCGFIDVLLRIVDESVEVHSS